MLTLPISVHLDRQNWRHLYWQWHDTIPVRIYAHPVRQYLQGSPLWQTGPIDHATPSVNNRPHLRNYTVVWPSNIGCSSAQRILQNKSTKPASLQISLTTTTTTRTTTIIIIIITQRSSTYTVGHEINELQHCLKWHTLVTLACSTPDSVATNIYDTERPLLCITLWPWRTVSRGSVCGSRDLSVNRAPGVNQRS